MTANEKYFTPANACKAWYQPTRRNVAALEITAAKLIYTVCILGMMILFIMGK